MAARALAALALAGALLGAAPAGAAERAIPYADMHEVFARLELMKGGRFFRADARLESTDPALPLAAVTLVIKSRTGDIAVPIDADGTTRFPVSAALLEENPPVMTNSAPGTLAFSVRIESLAPPVERFEYALLVAMQDEAEALVARQGLMARMFLPDFEGLAIRYPKGSAARATVEARGGPVVFEADADGIIHLPYRRAWRKENPAVQLSALPTQIMLDFD